MPQRVTLYRVFVAAPSDVAEELQVVEGVLRDWNLQHGQPYRARVETVNWRTHTRPAAGRRPQALVNQQAFDGCDIVVAIFWTRLGTPTGRADSGTVEEIKRGVRQGKQVLVYFSDRPPPGAAKVEHSRIQRFKSRFGAKSLYWVYNDMGSFERALRNHLAITMHALLRAETERS